MRSALTRISVAVLSVIAINAKAAPVELQGSWTMVKRFCTGDTAPNDRFQIGRDSMVFDISGDKLNLNLIIEGVNTQETWGIQAEGHKLKIDQNGRSSSYLYNISKNSELTLFGAAFGKGGTCPDGEGIMIIFQKK